MQILKTKPLLTKADSLCLCAEISDDTTDTTPFCFGVKRYKVWSHPVYNTTLPTVINRKPKRTCQAACSNTTTQIVEAYHVPNHVCCIWSLNPNFLLQIVIMSSSAACIARCWMPCSSSCSVHALTCWMLCCRATCIMGRPGFLYMALAALTLS